MPALFPEDGACGPGMAGVVRSRASLYRGILEHRDSALTACRTLQMTPTRYLIGENARG